MEANEAGELQEHAEHGAHDASSKRVAFTMSVLAVLVAVVTVLGHRTHTAAVLDQAKASDQWNFYQSKNLKQEIAINTDKILHILGNKQDTAIGDHQTDIARYDKEKAEIKKSAEEAEKLGFKIAIYPCIWREIWQCV